MPALQFIGCHSISWNMKNAIAHCQLCAINEKMIPDVIYYYLKQGPRSTCVSNMYAYVCIMYVFRWKRKAIKC